MKKKRKTIWLLYVFFTLMSLFFCYGFISTYEVSYFLGIRISPATQLEKTTDDCQVLNVAMVVAGYETTSRAIVLIKSLLSYYQKPIHFHFITDHRSMDVLPTLFETWQLANVEYSFYNSSNFINRVEWIPNNHYSKHFGLIKLLLPDILPNNVKEVLLLDTDLLILGKLDGLVDEFEKLTNGRVYGLVENMSRWYTTQDPIHHVWPALGAGFNTGVALVNLQRLREIDWNKIWRTVAEENLKVFGRTMLADQDILNAVFVRFPQLVHRLPCHFNVQMGLNSQPEVCKKDPSAFKIVHWNSPYKTRTRNRYAQFFRRHFEFFASKDGDSLRDSRSHCLKEQLSPSIKSYEYDEDDECGDFKRAAHIGHRTQKFLRPVGLMNQSDVTLVTQFDFDRLSVFEQLVNDWEGPISASVYLSDGESLELAEYWKQSRSLATRKNIAIHAIYKRGTLYPVNYLRNVAVNASKTEFILLIDVDFQPSQGIYSIIQGYLGNIEEKSAFILPAFERISGTSSSSSISKEDLKELMTKNQVQPFRAKIWPQGHEATNFTRWSEAKEIYVVKWEEDFEPYYLIRKSECPPFDERFVGFGWNKVAHAMRLHHLGFKFMVLPDGFLVHSPHNPSIEMLKYRSSTTYRKCMKMLKGEFVRDLLTGVL